MARHVDVRTIVVSDDNVGRETGERTTVVDSPRSRWWKETFEGYRCSLDFLAETDTDMELATDSSSSEKSYARFLLEPGIDSVRLMLYGEGRGMGNMRISDCCLNGSDSS